ncbi:MAG: hypothetical protein RLZZ35_1000 [Actinomycetota bacterium]
MSEETTAEVVTEEAATETKDPVAALTEDLQRLQAEFANYRKRVDRDRALAGEIAISSVLLEFLAVLDDLDRAEAHNELSGGFKAVAEQIVATTSKLGLEKYGALSCTRLLKKSKKLQSRRFFSPVTNIKREFSVQRAWL